MTERVSRRSLIGAAGIMPVGTLTKRDEPAAASSHPRPLAAHVGREGALHDAAHQYERPS